VLLDFESARVSELVDYAERTFRQVATDRSLQFEIATDELVPATIRTDPKRLQQILKNLLSNAFKFTERGKVSLRIALATSGWSPGHPGLEGDFGVLSFTVEDTGIGIPEAQRDAIFEAFRPGAGAAHYRGTGLGLSICRQLTRLLGGEIRIESTTGIGSRFTLYLPLKPGNEPTMRNTTHAQQPRSLCRPRTQSCRSSASDSRAARS
jgi:signal transduction histidine kinase